jgi:protein SCO1
VATQAAGPDAGQPLSSESLRGKVWVATFIEPTDPDCERLGEVLTRVQRRSRNLGDAWRMVSFVPGGAAPDEVQAFAERRHPNALRWFFAAVPPPVEAAVENAMYRAAVLAPLPGTGASRVHGKHLGVLVDAHGRIRGFYDLLTPSGENAVLMDMGLLANLNE